MLPFKMKESSIVFPRETAPLEAFKDCLLEWTNKKVRPVDQVEHLGL